MEFRSGDTPGPAWLGAPIDARPLFGPEHAALMATLRGPAPAEWDREAVPGWTVRDLAAHVLGDCYGRLARDRDHHAGGPAPAPGEPLETFIHRINREWVAACARVSPAALIETLDVIGAQTTRFLEAVDLTAPSLECPGPGSTRRPCG